MPIDVCPGEVPSSALPLSFENDESGPNEEAFVVGPIAAPISLVVALRDVASPFVVPDALVPLVALPICAALLAAGVAMPLEVVVDEVVGEDVADDVLEGAEIAVWLVDAGDADCDIAGEAGGATAAGVCACAIAAASAARAGIMNFRDGLRMACSSPIVCDSIGGPAMRLPAGMRRLDGLLVVELRRPVVHLQSRRLVVARPASVAPLEFRDGDSVLVDFQDRGKLGPARFDSRLGFHGCSFVTVNLDRIYALPPAAASRNPASAGRTFPASCVGAPAQRFNAESGSARGSSA
ncbi:MAG TPA: hypothetical protein VFJ86_02845 [Usitatibacter sp.]|nr:hypothetical protein [Usitatibacter sp.]